MREGEAWLLGLHVPEYGQGIRANHEPTARGSSSCTAARSTSSMPRSGRGFTVVPTKLYFKDGRVKVEIALARGKELHDKRRDIADRDAKRQIERELKSIRG